MSRTIIHAFLAACLLLPSAAVALAQEPEAAPPPATTPALEPAVAPVEPAPIEPAPANPELASPAPTTSPLPTTTPSQPVASITHPEIATSTHETVTDYTSLLYVFMLATFIGLGVILRVSRLLHTPLMSLTNAISAIAVVGSIIVTGNPNPNFPTIIRLLGAIALFASMTNIVSGFLITDRMLKMFKSPGQGGKR